MLRLQSSVRSVLVSLCVLVSGYGGSSPAQDLTTSATLNGTITDPSGAVIPGAVVTLSGAENGVTRSFPTTNSGSYSFRLLPPAAYTLKVEAPGFQTYKQDGIVLTAGQTATQTVELPLGSGSEQVSVTSEVPLLNLDNANLSAEISSKQVVELPLNLRNVFGLAVLNSSVQNGAEQQRLNGGGTQGTADQDISFLNFGGGFFGTTAFLLDGIWDTASDWGAVVYVPSVDSVDQFNCATPSWTPTPTSTTTTPGPSRRSAATSSARRWAVPSSCPGSTTATTRPSSSVCTRACGRAPRRPSSARFRRPRSAVATSLLCSAASSPAATALRSSTLSADRC